MWPFRDPPFCDPPFRDPPFWDPEKQKVSPNCNFFAIGDCRITLNLKYRRKSAGNQSCDDSFPLYGNRKESPIEKKLQKYPNFCFYNRRTTKTKQIRENYPMNAEWRLNAKLKEAAIQRPNAKLKEAAIQRPNAKLRGAAIHLGPAHPGRLPPSIQITPTEQNWLKSKRPPRETLGGLYF